MSDFNGGWPVPITGPDGKVRGYTFIPLCRGWEDIPPPTSPAAESSFTAPSDASSMSQAEPERSTPVKFDESWVDDLPIRDLTDKELEVVWREDEAEVIEAADLDVEMERVRKRRMGHRL